MNEKIKLIRSIINTNDGFTVDANGRPVEKNNGYFVSLVQTQNNDVSNIDDVILIASSLNTFIGGWNDQTTGRYYLDASIWIDDIEQAKKFGRLNSQLAIWDIANNTEIRL